MSKLRTGFQGHSCAQLLNDVKGRNISCRIVKQQGMRDIRYVECVREIRNDGEMQLENLTVLPTFGLSH